MDKVHLLASSKASVMQHLDQVDWRLAFHIFRMVGQTLGGLAFGVGLLLILVTALGSVAPFLDVAGVSERFATVSFSTLLASAGFLVVWGCSPRED